MSTVSNDWEGSSVDQAEGTQPQPEALPGAQAERQTCIRSVSADMQNCDIRVKSCVERICLTSI